MRLSIRFTLASGMVMEGVICFSFSAVYIADMLSSKALFRITGSLGVPSETEVNTEYRNSSSVSCFMISVRPRMIFRYLFAFSPSSSLSSISR